MKHIISKISISIISLLLLSLVSCEVDTLSDVKSYDPVVNLVQVGNDGVTTVTTKNIIIDKTNLQIKKPFGLAFSGFQSNEGFSAELKLEFNNAPDGYDQFSEGECYISASADDLTPIGSIEVPAGSIQRAFYINIKKSAINAHEGKKVGILLKVSKLTNYEINIDSTFVVMDMADFGTLNTEVTDTYLKNATFKRKAGTTARFASLADWTANDALTNTRLPDGAGYDQNVACMGVEKWGSGDPSITNGKIYQTFNLPKGHYKVILTMGQVRGVTAGEQNCLVVANGTEIPNDTEISTAVKYQSIGTGDENKDVSIDFTTTLDQQVSIGLLVNMYAGPQRVLQAKTIKMFKLTNLFD